MRSSLLLFATALALAGGAADAHPRLLSASPAPGGAVTGSPRAIRISFSEAVYPKLSAITVKNKAGAVVRTGPAVTPAGDRKQLVAMLAQPLARGQYVVNWRAVSVDTHHVQGSFAFAIR